MAEAIFPCCSTSFRSSAAFSASYLHMSVEQRDRQADSSESRLTVLRIARADPEHHLIVGELRALGLGTLPSRQAFDSTQQFRL